MSIGTSVVSIGTFVVSIGTFVVPIGTFVMFIVYMSCAADNKMCVY